MIQKRKRCYNDRTLRHLDNIFELQPAKIQQTKQNYKHLLQVNNNISGPIEQTEYVVSNVRHEVATNADYNTIIKDQYTRTKQSLSINQACEFFKFIR